MATTLIADSIYLESQLRKRYLPYHSTMCFKSIDVKLCDLGFNASAPIAQVYVLRYTAFKMVFMSNEEIREVIEAREDQLDALLDAPANEAGATHPYDTEKLENETRAVVTKGRQLEMNLKTHRAELKKQESVAKKFMENVKNDQGQIEINKLLKDINSFSQSVFDHALLLVAAQQHDIDRFRNLSNDHKSAISMIEVEKVKDKFQRILQEKDDKLRAAEADVIASNVGYSWTLS